MNRRKKAAAKVTPIKTNSALWRFGYWLLSPVGLTLLLSLPLLIINLLAVYHVRAYTSDDVIWQNALLSWHPFQHGTYYGDGAASYVAKIPFYWLLNQFMSPGRHELLVEGAVLIIGNFVLFYWAALYFLKKLGTPLTRLTLLPFIWLASFGFSLTQLFMAVNMHNIEVGLIFAAFAVATKAYTGEFTLSKSWRAIAIGILYCLVAGLTILDDRYFFYFGILPIIVTVGVCFIYGKDRKHFARLGIIALGLVGSFIVAGIFHFIIKAAGIELATSSNVVGAGPPQFVQYSAFFNNLSATIYDLFVMFGANFWGQAVLNIITIATLINAAVLGIVVSSAAQQLRVVKSVAVKPLKTAKHALSLPILRFFALLFFANIAVFAISTIGGGGGTYHYLMLLPFIAVILIAYRSALFSKTGRQIIGIVLIAGIFCNLYTNIADAKQPALIGGSLFLDSGNIANSQDYSLIQVLRDQGLTKGYGNYWDANITTYLSRGAVDMSPIICNAQGQTIPYKWLMVSNQYYKKAAKSFYVFDPAHPSPYTCPSNGIDAQFGNPQRIIPAGNDTVYIYNYDITSKIDLRESQSQL
jgi:hypothetical protein